MKMPDPGRLAARFDALLRIEIGNVNHAEVRHRNATPEYAGSVCATQDFCDANMVMFDAFRDECGRLMRLDDSGQGERDRICWNEAWDIAKADYLTEKP